MKKTIFIELLLLFNLAICLEIDIRFFIGLRDGYNLNYFAYLNFAATITLIVAIIFIAIKDFPVFKPLVDKLKAKSDARKAKKAERTETAKQNKIAALEAQLEELKKD